MFASVFAVVSCVEPDGVCTITNIRPWSSSGRNDFGRRTNSRPTATITTR